MEYKSRSLRIDDEVWSALQSHPLSANRILRQALELDASSSLPTESPAPAQTVTPVLLTEKHEQDFKELVVEFD